MNKIQDPATPRGTRSVLTTVQSPAMMSRIDTLETARTREMKNDTKPSLAAAMRYRDLTCPRDLGDGAGAVKEFGLCVPSGQFIQYGLGIYLYFKFLRRMGWIFFFFTLFALPAMVFNAAGDATEETYVIEQLGLGNQGIGNHTLLGFSKEDIGVTVAGLDTLSCVLFLIALYFMAHELSRNRHEYAEYDINIVRYSIMVTNVPPNTEDKSKMKSFFERFGPVADVALLYNDIDVIRLWTRRGQLKRALVAAQVRSDSKIQSIIEEIERVDVELEDLEYTFERSCVAAYVTFEHMESAESCLAAYPSSSLLRCCMPSKNTFQGHKIKVQRAPEPSNILFNNLKYSNWEKFFRRAFIYLIMSLMLIVSLSFVYLAQHYQNQIKSTDDPICTGINPTKQDAENNSAYVSCYCSKLSTSDIIQEKDFCSDWIEDYATAKGLLLAAAFTIVAINYGLRFSIKKIIRIGAFSSVSSLERATAKMLFVPLFINTAIIILVVNSDLTAYTGDWNDVLFSGDYGDFYVDWFNVVAVSVVFTLIVNILNPQLAPCALSCCSSCRRRCTTEEDVEGHTQTEINNKFAGADFHLAHRYASSLNIIFSTLFYSAGIPILLPLACLCFFLTYWGDKFAFFKYYRIPPRFDWQLERFALDMLPYAIIIHSLISIWFYTCPITSSYQIEHEEIESSFSKFHEDMFNITDRITSWNAFPLFCLFCVMASFKIIMEILTLAKAGFCFCVSWDEEPHLTSLKITYSQAVEKRNLRMESYHISKQPQFRMAYVITESRCQLEPSEVGFNSDDSEEELPVYFGPNQGPTAKAETAPSQTTIPGTIESPTGGKAIEMQSLASSGDKQQAKDGKVKELSINILTPKPVKRVVDADGWPTSPDALSAPCFHHPSPTAIPKMLDTPKTKKKKKKKKRRKNAEPSIQQQQNESYLDSSSMGKSESKYRSPSKIGTKPLVSRTATLGRRPRRADFHDDHDEELKVYDLPENLPHDVKDPSQMTKESIDSLRRLNFMRSKTHAVYINECCRDSLEQKYYDEMVLQADLQDHANQMQLEENIAQYQDYKDKAKGGKFSLALAEIKRSMMEESDAQFTRRQQIEIAPGQTLMSIPCPACGHFFRIVDAGVQQTFVCPNCMHSFVV